MQQQRVGVDRGDMDAFREMFLARVPRGERVPDPVTSDHVTIEVMSLVDGVCLPPWDVPFADYFEDVITKLLAVRHTNPGGYAWARREILAMLKPEPPRRPRGRRSSRPATN